MTTQLIFSSQGRPALHKSSFSFIPSKQFRNSHVRQFRLSEHPIRDWRVEDMVKKASSYYNDLWTKGEWEVCDDLLDEGFVFKDCVWGDDKIVVGPRGMSEYVLGVRNAYPDLWYNIQQVGLASWESVFVMWEASGTYLGYQNGHRAFGHNSCMQGIDFVQFDKHHQKVIAVTQFRQPTREDKLSLQQQDSNDMQTGIKLARLHFD